MATFDGENLTITLEPVVGGVLTVDAQDDLYTEWKAWMLAGNMRFPEAFRTTGGDPLTSIINSGSYFFLRNDFGWRLKPAENDGTYFVIGNLAAEDSALPFAVPTDGAFTALVLGLQPVTQGVTPAMAAQLEFNVFSGEVAVDTINGFAGTGQNGLDPIGSRRAPSNNMADALTIAVAHGLAKFNFLEDTAITSGDFSGGYIFTSDRRAVEVTVSPAANVSSVGIENLTIIGELDGLNAINGSDVKAVTAASGQINFCDFHSTIDINGSLHLLSCYSAVAGSGYPVLQTIGTNEIVVRDFRGSIGVSGMTGGLHSIGVYGGRLIIEADCTGGTIHVRGNPFEITDLSGLVTIVDQTASQKVNEIHKVMGLDISNPLTVTPTTRDAGAISQLITGDGETTSTVTRQ